MNIFPIMRPYVHKQNSGRIMSEFLTEGNTKVAQLVYLSRANAKCVITPRAARSVCSCCSHRQPCRRPSRRGPDQRMESRQQRSQFSRRRITMASPRSQQPADRCMMCRFSFLSLLIAAATSSSPSSRSPHKSKFAYSTRIQTGLC